MSEQELQAKLGLLVQQYSMTKQTVDSLRKTLGDLAVLYSELADCLPKEYSQGNLPRAYKALAGIPEKWNSDTVRELLANYQASLGELAGMQEQLKPYGLG